MKANVLNAQYRTERGKNANHQLRAAGFIPAVMYSHGKSESLKVNRKEFSNLFKGSISESVIIDLKIADQKEKDDNQVIVKDYQLNPKTDEVLHLDFYKITIGEKFHTQVPVHYIGTSKGERMGGILEVIERELDVESLPRDLPEKIEIDVTNLEIGDSIHVSDIPVSGSVKILTDSSRMLVSVIAPRTVKEEEVEEEVAEEGEVAEEKVEATAEEE